jgi:hypothetical protein
MVPPPSRTLRRPRHARTIVYGVVLFVPITVVGLITY